MQFAKPVLSIDPISHFTSVVMKEYDELVYVCKWLRAIREERFKLGTPVYLPDFSPYMDREIEADECFELLSRYCCAREGPSPYPSWSQFANFISFLHLQLVSFASHDLLNNGILETMEGLETFRTVFLSLLVETTKDFSLRSVPQLAVVGPSADAYDTAGCFDSITQATESFIISTLKEGSADEDMLSMPPPPLIKLQRQTSSELRNALQRMESRAPPTLVRQTSEEMVARFQSMLSWEQSDHPIVTFKMDAYAAVIGVDILSLNPTFVARHINDDLRRNLEATGFPFSKNWAKITNVRPSHWLKYFL